MVISLLAVISAEKENKNFNFMILQTGHPYVEPNDYSSAISFCNGINNSTSFYLTALILFGIIYIGIYVKYIKKKKWKISNILFLASIIYILFINEFNILCTLSALFSFSLILMIFQMFFSVIFGIAENGINFLLKNFTIKNIMNFSIYPLKIRKKRNSKERIIDKLSNVEKDLEEYLSEWKKTGGGTKGYVIVSIINQIKEQKENFKHRC